MTERETVRSMIPDEYKWTYRRWSVLSRVLPTPVLVWMLRRQK
jgi:hypothetical protein